MANRSYNILDTDCSLDLSEAIDILALVHFAAENADNQRDWFAIRASVVSAVYVVEKAVRRSLDKVEAAPRAAAGREVH